MLLRFTLCQNVKSYVHDQRSDVEWRWVALDTRRTGSRCTVLKCTKLSTNVHGCFVMLCESPYCIDSNELT
jgi:hypothetical protein